MLLSRGLWEQQLPTVCPADKDAKCKNEVKQISEISRSICVTRREAAKNKRMKKRFVLPLPVHQNFLHEAAACLPSRQ
jgi:hypothetical protein